MRSAYIITSKGTLDAYELGARRRGISTRHRQKYLNSSSVHSFFISCSPQQQQQQPHPISPRVLRLKSIASDAAVLNRLISSFFHSRSIVHTNNKHKNGLCSSISTVPSRAFAQLLLLLLLLLLYVYSINNNSDEMRARISSSSSLYQVASFT